MVRFAGWYGVIIGLLMLGQWGFFLVAGQVPELATAPVQFAFHFVAEMVTAIGLLISGIAMLKGKAWAARLYLAFAGMLIYSVINSPGYFAQQGQGIFVVMFGILLALALVSVARLVRNGRERTPQ